MSRKINPVEGGEVSTEVGFKRKPCKVETNGYALKVRLERIAWRDAVRAVCRSACRLEDFKNYIWHCQS